MSYTEEEKEAWAQAHAWLKRVSALFAKHPEWEAKLVSTSSETILTCKAQYMDAAKHAVEALP